MDSSHYDHHHHQQQHSAGAGEVNWILLLFLSSGFSGVSHSQERGPLPTRESREYTVNNQQPADRQQYTFLHTWNQLSINHKALVAASFPATHPTLLNTHTHSYQISTMAWHSRQRKIYRQTHTFLPSNTTRCCRVKINDLLKNCKKKVHGGGNGIVQWMFYNFLCIKFMTRRKAPAGRCTEFSARASWKDLLMFHDLPFNCT